MTAIAADQAPALPYPWADGPGLAPVLDDVELWPAAMTIEMRSVIKSIRPQSAVGRRRLAVDDDASVGAAVVQLLTSPVARRIAEQRFRTRLKRGGGEKVTHFGLSEFVAGVLVGWVWRSPGSPFARLLDDSLGKMALASDLTPDHFRDFALSVPESLTTDTALLACALAMLRRGDAQAYAFALIEHSPTYEALLICQPQIGETRALQASLRRGPNPEPRADRPAAKELTVRPLVTPRPPPNEPPASEPAATQSFKTETQSPITAISATFDGDPEAASSAADVTAGEPSRGIVSAEPLLSPRPSLHLKGANAEEQLSSTDVSLAQHGEAERSVSVMAETPEIADLIERIRFLDEELGSTSDLPAPSSYQSAQLAQAYLDELQILVMGLEEQIDRRRTTESDAAALADRIIAADPLEESKLLDADQCATLLDLLGGSRSKEPRAARWFDIAEDRLTVAILAILLHTDRDRAAQALSAFSLPQRRRLVRDLDAGHLATLLVPGTVDVVSVELVARIISARGRTKHLDDLHLALYAETDELSPRARELLKACLAADKRGEPVGAILRGLVVDRAQILDDRARDEVLIQIDQPPGMTGIYHRLRLSAQSRFLRPLRPHIVKGRAADALEQFVAFGELESMVSLCVEDLTSNAVRAFGAQHFEQTRRYLANFRDLLDEWTAAPADPTKRSGAEELLSLWGELVSDRDSFADELRVRVADPGATTALAPNVERWWYSEVGGALVVDESALAPRMLSSWVGAASGDLIPLEAWSWDRARALLDAKWDAQRSVERMIAARHYQAAQLAADAESSLARIVGAAVKAERARLEREFAAPLARARALRANTPEVDDYLASIEDALHALDFAEAELWLAGLDDHLVEQALREDPKQSELLDMLAEAGLRRSTPRPTLEDLQADVDRLRDQEGERRWHISVLEMIDQDLTSEQRDRLQGLARALDRPSRWPNVERSQELGDAIESTLAYLHCHCTQWREYHDVDPDDVTQGIVELLERTLPALPDGDDAARVVEIHREIDLHAPFMRVAELVSPGLRKCADAAYYESLRAKARDLIQRGEYGRALSDLRDVPDADALRLRAELFDRLYRGTPLDIDWKALRGIIAQLRGHEGDLGPSLLELDEIAQAIARIPSQNRPIDYLTASTAGADVQHRAALFVLSLHLKVALRRPPSEAVTLAMVLPEQIFRVWARWQLDLDAEQVPEGHSLTWRKVQALWDPDGRGNYMRIPAPGEKFPSFRCFAIFAQVEASIRRTPGLEQTLNGLYAALRTLQVRHDGAHALAQTTAARRQYFFALVERWLDQLYSACPANVRREEIEALFDPQD